MVFERQRGFGMFEIAQELSTSILSMIHPLCARVWKCTVSPIPSRGQATNQSSVT